MNRLNPETLGSLPASVVTPGYNRDQVGIGIVHLGVGAFHRGHQAYYTEKVLNAGGGDWGIVGASLRSPTVRDQLAPQSGLYTLVEKKGTEQQCQVIGAIKEVLVGPEHPQALIAQMANASTKVISLTITEKGYCHDPATGLLLGDHPAIQRDLTGYKENPATAIGYIVAALAKRKQQGRFGITLLSCDNLPHNGKVLQAVVLDFARRVDNALAGWIEKNVTFPCTMVDRIVPATTDDDLRALEQTLGVVDRGAVITEPFSQWVIENKFAQAVPDWAAAGALVVEDVAPFEEMKLRLLNGSHSIIAYLGYLAGYDYVHEVMADKEFHRLICHYMDEEVTPTLEVPAGFDLAAYKQQLCERFANPALHYKTRQVAQDGSQKIPQRWLSSVRELNSMDRKAEILALAVAGWVRYLESVRDSGESFTVEDPMANHFKSLVTNAENGSVHLASTVLCLQSIFGDLIECYPKFAADVERLHHRMKKIGVKALVNELVNSSHR